MTINFILNGEDVSVRAEAGVRLIEILRESFGLFGAKSGCLTGHCGACTVIYNGDVSLACLIPAFKLRGGEIITIEGYSQTIEYQEIITGFKQVHLGNCGDTKGIGELPFTCIPAAFLQAVSQAMDYCFKSVPLKRKEIWEMIRLRKIESAQGAK
jgi:hypothetical protein